MLAIKTEVAKSYDYWALSNEVLKTKFVLLPNEGNFHFGKLDSIKSAWKEVGLGSFNGKLTRIEALSKIFKMMSKENLIKQYESFSDFLESDHFLNFESDHFLNSDNNHIEDYESLNKQQLECTLLSLTRVTRGPVAAGAINFHKGFSMKNYSVVHEFFSSAIEMKNNLYGNQVGFEKLFKNILLTSGNEHMLKNQSFFLKAIKNGVFQFFSPMHLKTILSACDDIVESENSLALSYKEIQKLFKTLLETFEEVFIDYEGYWLEKERFSLEELNRKRAIVSPDIEVFQKKAKYVGNSKFGDAVEKNGEYKRTLEFNLEPNDEKNETVVELKDKERGYLEKDECEEFGMSIEDFLNKIQTNKSSEKQKLNSENLKQMLQSAIATLEKETTSSKDGKVIDLATLEKETTCSKDEKVIDEDNSNSKKSGQVTVNSFQKDQNGKNQHELQGFTSNKMNKTETVKVKNPYLTFERNPTVQKSVPSSKKIEITGVRIRRAANDDVPVQYKKKKDSRSFEILVSFPVKSSSVQKQNEETGVISTMDTWKFCVCIRSINSRTQGKSWFEMRPEVNVNVHELVYGLWDSNHKLLLGSNNKYTECIVEGVQKTTPIRISPDVNEYVEITTKDGVQIPVMQMAGICKLELTSDQNITSEINNVISEYKEMIRDRNYRDLFRMANWWTYCQSREPNPARIVEIIKAEEDYIDSFYESYIGNGKHTGNVYPYLVKDKSNVLTKVLPRVEVNAKVGRTLDQMLMNKDIRFVFNDMIGVYEDKYKSFVFEDVENADDSFLFSGRRIFNLGEKEKASKNGCSE